MVSENFHDVMQRLGRGVSRLHSAISNPELDRSCLIYVAMALIAILAILFLGFAILSSPCLLPLLVCLYFIGVPLPEKEGETKNENLLAEAASDFFGGFVKAKNE